MRTDGLAKLFLAWTKISEGKNPLEAPIQQRCCYASASTDTTPHHSICSCLYVGVVFRVRPRI